MYLWNILIRSHLHLLIRGHVLIILVVLTVYRDLCRWLPKL
jgi:hypothetical protein